MWLIVYWGLLGMVACYELGLEMLEMELMFRLFNMNWIRAIWACVDRPGWTGWLPD
jgi:hypothetical protein